MDESGAPVNFFQNYCNGLSPCLKFYQTAISCDETGTSLSGANGKENAAR
ncbi:hypothetical protein ABIE50_005463 [Chitinophaga sp. OAE865]